MTEKANVVLLFGDDPFLLREAAMELVAEVRAVEMEARDWAGGETADLATPSLFGERRGLVVRDCRHLPEGAVREIGAYLDAPSPDAILVLVAEVGERGRPPAALVKLLKDRGEVREVSLARKDLARWIVERAKRKGLALRSDAAGALVDTLGESPSALDAAIDQLGVAFPGAPLIKDLVLRQFQGLGEQRMWDLCDRAFTKDLPGAARSLASLLDSREDPLAILGVVASRLRDLLRVKALPDSTPPADVARAAGLRFEWQGRKYRDQARRFSMHELVGLHEDVVDADRVMKSGAPGDVVLPVVVAKVAGAPEPVPSG